tara:strand:- start:421 stop:672 length:252 start_codon:yes stop_codon:yes gene_type:complete
MAEDILADLMGSFLIVAPAVFGLIFAYWLFKKVRHQRSQRPKIDASRFERCRRSPRFRTRRPLTAAASLARFSPVPSDSSRTR